MNIYTSLALIALAAGTHASFQLSVSMITLLSGRALGAKTRHRKLLSLTNSFLAGAAVMTLLLLSMLSLIFATVLPIETPQVVWASVCGLLVGVGVAVWAFYYRPGKTPLLWVPRGMARYLSSRIRATRMGGEAFGLGLSSVLAETIFMLAPLLVASLLIIRLPGLWQLVGLLGYCAIAMLSLGIVTALIGSGHRISAIQRWRDANKRFLQFAGGAGLLILGFYLFVNQILAENVTVISGALQ